MSTEGWPGPMAPSPQPPPPDPIASRVAAAVLDHVFDVVPALLLFGFLVATSHPFHVEFAAALMFARPSTGKPQKPPKPARPPKSGTRRPLGKPPTSS